MRIPKFEDILKFDKKFFKSFGTKAAEKHKEGMLKGRRPSGPVWKKLSTSYETFKKSKGLPGIADYKLSGRLHEDFDYITGFQLADGEFEVYYGISPSKSRKYPDKRVNTANVANLLHSGEVNKKPRPLYDNKRTIYKITEEPLVKELVGQLAVNIAAELDVPVLVIKM
tara:strand:- start:1166 stop:1672 length:507 start_codon:yes stop_codon:yes gene_type:complete